MQYNCTAAACAGYSPTLFEKTGDVGGVWQSNYAGYRLQVYLSLVHRCTDRLRRGGAAP